MIAGNPLPLNAKMGPSYAVSSRKIDENGEAITVYMETVTQA
jgi:hypothetical protein